MNVCYSRGMTLTTQQQAGLNKVMAWYEVCRDEPGPYPFDVKPMRFRWFGYAGTGKTFTAARIPEVLGLERVVFGTYTGKAASVLRRALAKYGVAAPVTTIHSAIYKPMVSKEAMDALADARDELSQLQKEHDQVMALAEPERLQRAEAQGWSSPLELAGRLSEVSESIPGLEREARKLHWNLNPDSEWARAELIILDEVSMVNAKMAADVESYGVPVLVLGDPAQLPPVEGGGYYTEASPDHLLTDIQRQAAGSPVIEMATRVRTSDAGMGPLGLQPQDMRRPSLAEVMEADVALCWTNKRRWSLLNAIRARRGFPPGRPVAGDKVMVLTNNQDAGVFNGEIFTVKDAAPDALGWMLVAVDDDGIERALSVYADGFNGLEAQKAAKNGMLGARGQRALATFAQVITVHKAQGSQWPHVYVVNEYSEMIAAGARRRGRSEALADARAHLYTAITRAEHKVTITLPK